MKSVFVVWLSAAFLCTCALAQGVPPEAGANVMYFQQSPAPTPPDAQGNVTFRTGGALGAKTDTFFIQMAEDGKIIAGAPYTATATTESTQTLADGNHIVNKTSSLLARDGQGRTRREETMSSVGPWKVPAKTVVFINDPVAQTSYVLDVNDKTAQVLPRVKPMSAPAGGGGAAGKMEFVQSVNTNIERKIMVTDGPEVMERHVVVSMIGGESSDQAKTESLGTQVMEGVTVVGKKVTRTIPAGQIGNERPIEITSEVWTSPDLKMVVLSKRNDPRIGETVYRLTDIRRAEPDHSMFEVPAGYTVKEAPPLPPLPPVPPAPATPSPAPGSSNRM